MSQHRTQAILATAAQSTPPSIGSKTADRAAFALAVTPVLTLCVPTGMDQAERRAWLSAAHMALGDVPADRLRDAALHAMRVADHPAKIVPAIHAYLTPKDTQADRELDALVRAAEKYRKNGAAA